MTNINYRIEKSSDKLVLVSQITGAKPFEVVGVNSEVSQLILSPSFPGNTTLEISRIDDIDTQLLKEHFPESYI